MKSSRHASIKFCLSQWLNNLAHKGKKLNIPIWKLHKYACVVYVITVSHKNMGQRRPANNKYALVSTTFFNTKNISAT